MTPDKAKIKASLEAMQIAFHELLHEIPDALWRHPCPDSTWLVCQDMWHVVQVQYVYAHAVQAMRRGKNYPLTLKALRDLAALGIGYFIPPRANKEKVAAHFDHSLKMLLSVLGHLHEDEWALPGRLVGLELTPYKIYRALPNHFDEHAERVQELLYS